MLGIDAGEFQKQEVPDFEFCFISAAPFETDVLVALVIGELC
jgi:hypothetical protein